MRLLFSPMENGIYVAFENSRGRYWSFFNSPPKSISHVGKEYLRNRFPNVRDKRHVDFIKHHWDLVMNNNAQFERDESILAIGDKVVMHTCHEAQHETYRDRVWIVESHPWSSGGREVVMLSGFSGAFATKFLRRVDDDTEDGRDPSAASRN